MQINLNPFKKRKTAFLPLYIKITEDIKAGRLLTPSGDRYAYHTGNNYQTGTYRFRLWEQEKGTIFLEDISPAWAEQFTIFQMEKGYAKNSISGSLGRLKAVLKRLHGQGIGDFDGRGIRAPGELVTTVYSTMDDLQLLLDVDLSETAGFERVRDVYIIQCFVGLRFSDLRTFLKKPHDYIKVIGGRHYIEIKTRKTGAVIVIPLNKTAKFLLEKNNYNFNELFSEQYYNLSIKEIASRAGINDTVIFSRTEGGQRVDTPKNKSTIMSSHTARRTFATNAYLAGLRELDIMQVTGHKTTASFHRYIRCSNFESAIKIANHDFFQLELSPTLHLKHEEEQAKIENTGSGTD